MLLRRFSRPLTWALPLALCAGLLLQPDAAAQAARAGLLLCGNLVVPALFPFFILSSLLVSTGAPPGWAAVVRGHGEAVPPDRRQRFGVGAGVSGQGIRWGEDRLHVVRRKLCDRTQAEHLLMFCNNLKPRLHPGRHERCHLPQHRRWLPAPGHSNLLRPPGGFLTPPRPWGNRPNPSPPPTPPSLQPLSHRVRPAGGQRYGGERVRLVIFFNVVLRLLDCCGQPGLCRGLLALCHCPDAWQLPLLSGVRESCQRGGAAVWYGGWPHPAAFLLSWGGCRPLPDPDLSHPARPEPAPLLSRKVLQGCISAALACLALRFLPPGATDAESHPTAPEQPLAGTFGVPLTVACGLVLGCGAGWVAFGKKTLENDRKKSIISGIMDRN